MKFHYFKQDWLSTPEWRWRQRFSFFWPRGEKWRGVGVVIWTHELSVRFGEAQ